MNEAVVNARVALGINADMTLFYKDFSKGGVYIVISLYAIAVFVKYIKFHNVLVYSFKRIFEPAVFIIGRNIMNGVSFSVGTESVRTVGLEAYFIRRLYIARVNALIAVRINAYRTLAYVYVSEFLRYIVIVLYRFLGIYVIYIVLNVVLNRTVGCVLHRHVAENLYSVSSAKKLVTRITLVYEGIVRVVKSVVHTYIAVG